MHTIIVLCLWWDDQVHSRNLFIVWFRRWQAPRVYSTHRAFSTRRLAKPYIKVSENKFVIGPDVFGGEDNSAIFQPIELKLSVCIGLIIPQVIYYVSSNVVDHGSNESTFTCFYCILCDSSLRTYVASASHVRSKWTIAARGKIHHLCVLNLRTQNSFRVLKLEHAWADLLVRHSTDVHDLLDTART